MIKIGQEINLLLQVPELLTRGYSINAIVTVSEIIKKLDKTRGLEKLKMIKYSTYLSDLYSLNKHETE